MSRAPRAADRRRTAASRGTCQRRPGRVGAVLLVVGTVGLTACGGGSAVRDAGPAPDVPPLTPAQVAAAGTLALSHVVQGRRAVSRTYRSSLVCAAPRQPPSDPAEARDVTAAVRGAFVDVLGDALGFPLAGRRDSLFDASAGDAEFALAARITTLRYALCRHMTLAGRHAGTSGRADADLTVEVQDRIAREVVFTGTVSATARLDDPVPGTAEDALLARLFTDALAQLAADNTFRRAIVTGIPKGETLRRADADAFAVGAAALIPAAASPGGAGRLTLTGPALFRAPMTLNVDRLRAATVTVLGLSGHGSGFFVAPDGWLLTNAHVVEGGEVFRVRLSDDRELWARVERRHPVRDVALLKVAGRGFEALPIRPTLAQVSETTYAIGTPASRALGQTVSQGIVSAYRRGAHKGLDVYQATTPIHAGNSGGPLVDAWGNVVAVSVAIISEGSRRLGAGLGFFIPIHDALAHVGVEVAPQAPAPAPAPTAWQAWAHPAQGPAPAPVPTWAYGAAAPGGVAPAPWTAAPPALAGPWPGRPAAPPSPTPPAAGAPPYPSAPTSAAPHAGYTDGHAPGHAPWPPSPTPRL
ncbi:S1C family serine protease [Roseospira goensis]|uniref:S1-C subfamily serine protease n=1 Tax=Roseospira goensis TaxID=391922 RepID=A0A7W6WKD7_9PROT|nr:trypsin-like peptidase domain-containing protein [Roseospira goensis]MBB4285332.1 S1-C subfamily serine protease [Roseospira goensis]